jgi:hypothetical protein
MASGIRSPRVGGAGASAALLVAVTFGFSGKIVSRVGFLARVGAHAAGEIPNTPGGRIA